MSSRIIGLIIMTAGFSAVAVYGGATGSEALLGTGLAGALLCLVLIPAYAVRVSRKNKISVRKDGIICFKYSLAEAEEIAAAAKPDIRRRSIRISAALSICLAVIFAPFVLLSLQPGFNAPPLPPIAIPIIILPWASVLIAPAVTVYNIRKAPCVSFVGRNCLLITNRYMGINDRCALEADAVRFEAGKDGNLATLQVRYRYRAGRVPTKIQHWVKVPVPRGREAEAAAACREF